MQKAQFIKEAVYWELSKFKTFILKNTIIKIKNKPQTRENVCKTYIYLINCLYSEYIKELLQLNKETFLVKNRKKFELDISLKNIFEWSISQLKNG